MAEAVKKEEEKKEEKKKGPLGKLKEFSEDKEEQMEIFSTFVRLGILVWSGGILTLNYVSIPNFPQKNIDPTFIASVFTGVLASFGIQTASKKTTCTNIEGRHGDVDCKSSNNCTCTDNQIRTSTYGSCSKSNTT